MGKIIEQLVTRYITTSAKLIDKEAIIPEKGTELFIKFSEAGVTMGEFLCNIQSYDENLLDGVKYDSQISYQSFIEELDSKMSDKASLNMAEFVAESKVSCKGKSLPACIVANIIYNIANKKEEYIEKRLVRVSFVV